MAKTTNTTTNTSQRTRVFLISGLMVVAAIAGLGIAYLLLTAGTQESTTVTTTTPSVTSALAGTLTNGATVLITGSNFGTKPTAAPLKFDTFENEQLNVGKQIANGWASECTARYGNIPGTNPPQPRPDKCVPPFYSTGQLRPGSAVSVQANFEDKGYTDCPDPEGCNWESSFGIKGIPMNQVYLDAWVYYAPASPESRNVKLLRVHSNTYSPNVYFNIYCLGDSDGARLGQDPSGAGTVTNLYVPDNPDKPGGPDLTKPWRGTSFFMGNWRHIQLYLSESSPNLHDGTAVLTIDGAVGVNRVNNYETRTDVSQIWDTVWFGNYLGHGAGSPSVCQASPGNSYTYWDNVYIDTTRAHVELGNADHYSTSTLREVQPATSWSDTGIQATLNQGGLQDLNNVWVYVVDSNGAVNDTGFKLIGAPVDTTAPTVAITNPTAGTYVAGAVPIAAAATDNVAVSRVEFYKDSDPTPFATDSAAPYVGNLTTTSLSNGTHSTYSKAYDLSNNVGASSTVSLTVDNTAPTTSITAPTAGSTVSGAVTVRANASDNIGVVGVQLQVDGVNYGIEDTSSPYSITWGSPSFGNTGHQLRVIARDAAGNQTTSAIVAVTSQNTGSGSTGGGGGCFPAETLVNTPSGLKPIGELKMGDAIYAYDQVTGRTVTSTISQTFVHQDKPYGVVTFIDGSKLEVTSVHRFFNPAAKQWQEIGTMKPGDVVLKGIGSSAKPLTISSLEFTSHRGIVYNLEVGRYHTYYVEGIVVHNAKQAH